MNMTKILTICSLVVIIIGVSLWLLLRVPFITQSMENVDRITVVFYSYFSGGYDKEEIYITEQSEIEYAYSLLKATNVTLVDRWPDHSSSLQFDSAFIIHLEYRNGKKDIIKAKSSSGIFRMLNTTTNHGDQGYVMGTNEELWEYVLSLSKN